MGYTQTYTQKHTHGLAEINAGLSKLRKTLLARVPRDFETWFMVDGYEFAAGWSLIADGEVVETGEVRALNLAALLVKWHAIDWKRERHRAGLVKGAPRHEGVGVHVALHSLGSERAALAGGERDRAEEVTAARKVPEGARTDSHV